LSIRTLGVQVLQAAPELVKEAAPLAPAVSPVLADAVAKAATRSEGISALLILATLAAQDAAASEHCEKQKVRGCPKRAAFRLDGISCWPCSTSCGIKQASNSR